MKNFYFAITFVCASAILIFSSCKKDGTITAATPVANGETPAPAPTSGAAEEDGVVETLAPTNTPVSALINDNCAGYYETLPTRYDSSSKKYPLILFIHGIGELGNGSSDLPNMLRAGLPRLINKKLFPPDFQVDGNHYSFVVISPQFKNRPTNAEVNSVLQYALKKYRVDESRVYLTGLSMGGGVTWEFSADHGEALTAIVPLSGGSAPATEFANNIANANLPVWAFHNTDDNVVPVSYTLDYVAKINSFNPTNKAMATIWAIGGHDCWTKGYDPSTRENGKNIYEWMLGFTREH